MTRAILGVAGGRGSLSRHYRSKDRQEVAVAEVLQHPGYGYGDRRYNDLALLRLAKASFTFAGGIDYLAWKINRHAGTDIQITAWQRRWPLVAALILLPRLLARGVVR